MRTISVIAVFVLFVFSCGPSVDSESKSWTENLQKAEELKVKRPAYAALIDSKIEMAKKVWEESSSISEEESKAAKMQEANDFFETGEVYKLATMEEKIQEVKDYQEKLAGLATLPDEQERAENARINSTNAITLAEQVFATTTKLTVEDASIRINNAFNKLESSCTELNGIISVVTDRVAKESEVKDTSKTDATTGDKAALIKCEYCGTSNNADATKCASCSAAVEHK